MRLLLLSVFCFFIFMGNAQPQIKTYNCISFEAESKQNFSMLDSVVPNYQVFLIGETHGVSSNPKLVMELLPYLHEKANVRNLVIEFGYTDAYLINYYLATGDSFYLKPLFYYRYKEYRDFWRELYRFNQRLSPEKRITVVGIDFEYSRPLAFMLNYLIIRGKKIPDEILPAITNIMLMDDSLSEVGKRKFLLRLRKDVYDKQAIYQTYFEEGFPILKSIIDNNSFYASFEKRDKEMQNNFLKYHKELKGNYLGIMGMFHVNASKEQKYEFAYQLNKDIFSPFKGKVLSFNCHYENCHAHYRNETHDLTGGLLSYYKVFNKKEKLEFEESVNQIKDCNILLLDLLAPQNNLEKIAVHGRYLFYIRNQAAFEVIKEKKKGS